MLQNLSFLTDEQSRSISAENPTGEPGNGARCELDQGIARNAARDLGKGWKVNPYVFVQPHETVELANIKGLVKSVKSGLHRQVCGEISFFESTGKINRIRVWNRPLAIFSVVVGRNICK